MNNKLYNCTQLIHNALIIIENLQFSAFNYPSLGERFLADYLKSLDPAL